MRAPSPIRCGPTEYREINNFYTATVYEKGAEVVRMLETLLGERGFRKGMDLYFERHDGEAATIEDFLACFADATGARPRAVRALVPAGRDAARDGPTIYDAGRAELPVEFEQSMPPTPGQPTKDADAHPDRASAWSLPTARPRARRVPAADVDAATCCT